MFISIHILKEISESEGSYKQSGKSRITTKKFEFEFKFIVMTL